MRRIWWWVAAVAVVVAAAGVTWWAVVLPRQQVDAGAQRVVAAFKTGDAPEGAFTEPVAPELARVYAGMGSLRPAVTVREVAPDADGSQRARLAWSWVIHEGKQAWDYETTVRLVRDGADWRGQYAPDAVAPALRPGDALKASRLSAPRAAILGHDGTPLAATVPAFRVGIDKAATDQATAVASAAQVAAHVGIDVPRYVERVEKAGPRAFVEARVLREGDAAEQALAQASTRWIGARALPATYPLGRTATFARPLLGSVGEATAEQVADSGGTIRAGDLAGRGGLQQARNHVLAGTSGFVVQYVDGRGETRDALRVAALPGTDVVTTLDVGLQERAEAALGGIRPASAVVALRPSDGAILAAASGAGGDGLSTATVGQYAPGSTFKIVTALAMLRAGATADTPVPCTDGFTVDGYRFDNWQGYPATSLGEVPLREAFAWSCNSAFLAQADALGPEKLADAAASLGLVAEPGLVVGGFLGRVPTDGTRVERAAATIGQGRVLASPLGMATVAASVAAGHTVTPVLVDEPGRTPAPAPALSPAEASTLRELMRGVVTGGTASGLAGLGDVAAKTGTASWGQAPVRFHGWVVVLRGDLAVAAFVGDAAGAGEAIEVARRFLG